MIRSSLITIECPYCGSTVKALSGMILPDRCFKDDCGKMFATTARDYALYEMGIKDGKKESE